MVIDMQWTPASGMQLLSVWTYDGEVVYPDFPGQPPSWADLGLAPLPGDPPCEGDDCKECINQQLAICYSAYKADFAVATSVYVVGMAGCAALYAIPVAGPYLFFICVNAAAAAYSAAIYKAKVDRRTCEHDRPRTWCKHAENGLPCLN
jgi:hypothetical protein